mmetsp:Transcript_3330/g.6272  ORF Transcript_3330/g.6272 Transcript_3330/m.6272 type:complete len:305 (+) Transcript_3330:250-1164(+)
MSQVPVPHENVIRLLNVIKAENLQDVYLVFEYMEVSLHQVLQANILEEVHKKYILYQVIKALKYLHSGSLIHRDVKPSNVLLNSDCLTKLCDFGLCRSVANLEDETKESPVMTDYVATRWYRAPEILLGSSRYTKGVDMWGAGCILAELLLGEALFQGSSTLHQLQNIMEVTGWPTKQDIKALRSDFTKTILDSLPSVQTTSLRDLIPHASTEALDLLRKLLQFNPDKRINAESALAHPYLAQFHNPGDEAVCSEPIVIAMDDDPNLKLADYRKEMYKRVALRKIQVRKSLRRRKNPESEEKSD